MNPIQLSRADADNLVEFAKMDLGESSSMLAGCCSPVSEKSKKWYPSFYVNKAEKLDLPLTGKATIEYRLRSQTKRQDDAGKVSHSADIEVISIDPEVEEVKPVAGGKAVVTKKDFATEFASKEEIAKALANGAKRPLTTAKTNPFVMRRTDYGETRISPRTKLVGRVAAESKANYVPGAKAEGRQAAAAMLREHRKTKMLSRADARALVEFARAR